METMGSPCRRRKEGASLVPCTHRGLSGGFQAQTPTRIPGAPRATQLARQEAVGFRGRAPPEGAARSCQVWIRFPGKCEGEGKQ